MGQSLPGTPMRTRQTLRIGMVVPSLATPNGHVQVETPAVSLLANHLHHATDLTVFAVRQPPGVGGQPASQTEPRVISAPFTSGTAAPPRSREILRQALQAIVRAHREQPFDMLHALWLYESGAAAVLAARILRLPVIVSIGGAEVANLPAIGYGMRQTARGRAIVRSVLRGATRVTGGSTSVLELADVAAGRALRSQRLPLPIDATSFAAANTPAQGHAVVQVAALLPVKQQSLLLRALQLTQHSLPGTSLTIYGEDPLQRAEALLDEARRLGIRQLVTCGGRIPHVELPRAVTGHRLHVQTSYHESQGLGVLEAAAAGIPSVGTNVGVLRDLAPDAALAVPHPDPALLADAIVDLLKHPGRCDALRQAALDRVRREYDVKPVVQRWLTLYADVVAAHGSAKR